MFADGPPIADSGIMMTIFRFGEGSQRRQRVESPRGNLWGKQSQDMAILGLEIRGISI